MKFSKFILTPALIFFLFSLSTLSAQEERTAKKYENPQWQRIVFIDYHSGKTGKAREIVEKYFKEASKKAGTQGPSTTLVMNTGQYDYILIWDLKEGLESMNWETSPDNIKWWKAMVELAGSEEKAKAIQQEYNSCVRSAKAELARKE